MGACVLDVPFRRERRSRGPCRDSRLGFSYIPCIIEVLSLRAVVASCGTYAASGRPYADDGGSLGAADTATNGRRRQGGGFRRAYEEAAEAAGGNDFVRQLFLITCLGRPHPPLVVKCPSVVVSNGIKRKGGNLKKTEVMI